MNVAIVTKGYLMVGTVGTTGTNGNMPFGTTFTVTACCALLEPQCAVSVYLVEDVGDTSVKPDGLKLPTP